MNRIKRCPRCMRCTMATGRVKQSLVEFGFRLPSAFDNRPLKFEEIYRRIHQVVYVSATPAHGKFKKPQGEIVQQIIRPTGLIGSSHRSQAGDRSSRRLPGRDPARRQKKEDASSSRPSPKNSQKISRKYFMRDRCQSQISPFRYRHDRADADHQRPAPRRFRCAGRDQPFARRPGYPRSFACGHSRCR